MADFGYSPGDGTGTGVPTLLAGFASYASRYLNTTGARFIVDRVDLLNVNTAHASGTFVVQLFRDAPGSFDYPTLLAATAPTVTALALGANSFDFSGAELSLGTGEGVWVVLSLDRSTGFDGDILAGGAIAAAYPGSGVWGDLFGGGSVVGHILPARIFGTGTYDPSATELRAALAVVEPVTEAAAALRLALAAAEPVTEGPSALRMALAAAEPVTEGPSTLRAALVALDVVISLPEEAPVATAIFPVLRGKKWDVKKSPKYNTAARPATSGRETRTAYMQYPVWTFEYAYDYLPDLAPGVSGYSDLRTLAGFFLQMRGSFEAWLYRDIDDYHVLGGAIATGDGVTVQWPFFRDFGGFLEPVGQIDLSVLETFASTAVNTGTSAIHVAGHGLATGQGPLFVSSSGALPTGLAAATSYWAIAVDADHFQLASSLANALAATPIALAAAGSGNDTLTKGVAVYDNGVLQGPAAYTLTLPNQLVFAVAPTAGHLITADFDFWYVCRFTDDTAEFNQFASKLWDLQKLDFQSVIQ